MEQLLLNLSTDYPNLLFIKGTSFHWSPQTRQIFYVYKNSRSDTWSILHETAHAVLNHTNYSLDLELLHMEVAAWEVAKKLGEKYHIAIDEGYIQDCLDSYRDWLYKRSACPLCSAQSIQDEHTPQYRCFNCGNKWQISPSRFCRPYRHNEQNKESSAMCADDSVSASLKA